VARKHTGNGAQMTGATRGSLTAERRLGSEEGRGGFHRLSPAAWSVVLFGLGFVLRFVYVLHLQASPLVQTPMLDELYHVEWARTLAAGDWIGSSVFFRAPLYPYLLGLIMRLFGGSLFAARVVQAVYGSLTPAVVYLLARRLTRNAWAVAAGVAALLYPFFIYFDNELLIVSLIVLLDAVALLFLLRADERPTWGRWAAAGGVLGLSAIARPNILVFIPFVFLWIWWSEVRRRRDGEATPSCVGAETTRLVCPTPLRTAALRFVVLALGAAVVVAPVTLRNYIVERDFVLIASQGGVNFYIGNNASADGVAAVLPELGEAWEYEDAIRIAERDAGRELAPSEVSAWWYARGRAFIASRSGEAAALYLRKLVLFWDSFEQANNKDIYFFGAYSPVFRGLSWLSFGLLAPLGLLGMFVFRKQRAGALLATFVLTYMGTVLLFFVNARFRLPVLPALIVLGAAGVAWFVERFRRSEWRAVVCAAIVLTALYVFVNADLYGTRVGDQPQTHNAIGLAYASQQRYDDAVASYVRALELWPAYAKAMNNMGLALEGLGRDAEAETMYAKAAAADTTHASAPNNLGALLGRQGRTEEALRSYGEAVRRAPMLSEARINLGSLLLRMGRLEDAQRELEAAVAIRPDFAEAWNALGVAYEELDLPAKSIAAYSRAVSLAPGSADARNNLAIVLARTGQYEEAIAELETALRISPGDPKLEANLQTVRRLMGGRQ